jgi:aspartyl-tRNA(Asn)/glutamyl-tRNA(Gln) amidotransferase subunit B
MLAITAIKIGLEIHCQLTHLQSKLFCPCYSDYRGKTANTNVCPICYGLPGTLPLLNQRAIESAGMISLALGCQIPQNLVFYRKNYFYPDLPKNFQLTQYNAYGITSIGVNGKLYYYGDDVDGGTGKVRSKSARIRRVQIEEDPGRLVYENGNMDTSFYTLIDYNRAGICLVEIVTEPDFTDPKDVRIFLNKITSIIEHLEVCNTNLEGAVRCDVNVSIDSGKRVEIKNIGSFKEVEKAITYEIARQKTMSLHNIEVKSETRHWDDARKVTKQPRTKEEEQDYRYFPEPDIPTIILGNEFVSLIKTKIPELPDARKTRFITYYNLSEHVSQVLIDNKDLADLFESAVKIYSHSPKEIANWIVTDLVGSINDANAKRKHELNEWSGNKVGGGQEEKEEAGRSGSLLSELKIGSKHIAELAKLVDQNIINRNTAKSILSRIVNTGEMPSQVIEKTDTTKINDKKVISEAVESIFNSEKSAVKDAKQNPNAANFLLGKVMQLTKGRADPGITLNLIKAKLDIK